MSEGASRDKLGEKYGAQAGCGPHLLNSSGQVSEAVECVNRLARANGPMAEA